MTTREDMKATIAGHLREGGSVRESAGIFSLVAADACSYSDQDRIVLELAEVMYELGEEKGRRQAQARHILFQEAHLAGLQELQRAEEARKA